MNTAALFGQRLENNKAYLKEPLEEVFCLLDYDMKQLELFQAALYIVFLNYRPERLKSEQEGLQKAKRLQQRLSKKAHELSLLFEEFLCLELPNYSQDIPKIDTFSLILKAGERTYSDDGERALHQEESRNYNKIIKPAIKKVSKDFEVSYSCPCISEFLFELHQEIETIEFSDPDIRQPSARSMTVEFYRQLIRWASDGLLQKSILDISLKTTAHLINITLDLDGDSLMSEEVAGKAINKAIRLDNEECRAEQDN